MKLILISLIILLIINGVLIVLSDNMIIDYNPLEFIEYKLGLNFSPTVFKIYKVISFVLMVVIIIYAIIFAVTPYKQEENSEKQSVIEETESEAEANKIVAKAFDLEADQYIEYTVIDNNGLYEIYKGTEKIADKKTSNYINEMKDVTLSDLKLSEHDIDLRKFKVSGDIYSMTKNDIHKYVSRSQIEDGCKLLRYIETSKYTDVYLLQPDGSCLRLMESDGEVIMSNIGILKSTPSELGKQNSLPSIINYLT